MYSCGNSAYNGVGVSVLCVLAVHAVSPCGNPYFNRYNPYKKMLTGVHIMKVVVMKSPKAFAWIFRLIFGIKAKRV